MTFADTLIEGVSGAAAIAISVLLIRLALDGQRRNYPWFFAWLLALYIEAFVSFIDTSQSLSLRRSLWIFGRLAVTAIEVRLIMSLFRDWAAGLPDTGFVVRRRVSAVIVSISAAAALATAPWGDLSGVLAGTMGRAIAINRAANTGFSVFLLLTLGYFRRLQVPTAPNIRRITAGMAACVTGNALAYFLLTRRYFLAGNLMLPAIVLCTMAYWFLSIRPSGRLRSGSELTERRSEALMPAGPANSGSRIRLY